MLLKTYLWLYQVGPNPSDCSNFILRIMFLFTGKTPQLYRHDLLALLNKQSHRFSLHMNRIPERLVPRKFALTTRVPDTKGTLKCCIARNPYNGYKYLRVKNKHVSYKPWIIIFYWKYDIFNNSFMILLQLYMISSDLTLWSEFLIYL